MHNPSSLFLTPHNSLHFLSKKATPPYTLSSITQSPSSTSPSVKQKTHSISTHLRLFLHSATSLIHCHTLSPPATSISQQSTSQLRYLQSPYNLPSIHHPTFIYPLCLSPSSYSQYPCFRFIFHFPSNNHQATTSSFFIR
ncbi:unnamed protein product [Vicia faba]|uniref:Uncharacterized protein n=1 Tax=Vicia faba TaxID=3906 RepID=A0AAV0YEC2_VICFA|nr:unnamed protein product [Vicia faba]CAI8582904.1 unnamed protein product [Vicia faba]